MPEPVYVYALIDPRTDEPYYIGRTRNPRTRLSGHISQGWETVRSVQYYDYGYPHRLPHIVHTRDIVLADQRPVFEILETVTGEDWRDAEYLWVEYFRSVGCPIGNSRPGGQGNPDRVFPERWRKYVTDHIEEFLTPNLAAELLAHLIPPGYRLVRGEEGPVESVPAQELVEAGDVG